VTGCHTYTQICLAEVADHGKVRVTLISGERETLRDPWVDGGSIKAYTSESVRNLGPKVQTTSTVAFPVDRIAKLEAKGTNEVGTVFAVLGIVVVVGAAVVAIACSNTSGQCFNVY
jgi:hypothetical protein